MSFDPFERFADDNRICEAARNNPSCLLPPRHLVGAGEPFRAYLDLPKLKNDPAEKLNRLAMAVFVQEVHHHATMQGLPSSHICSIAEACLREIHSADSGKMKLIASSLLNRALARDFANSPLHAYVYVARSGKIHFDAPPFEGRSELFEYCPEMSAYFRKALSGNSPAIRGSATINYNIFTSRDLVPHTNDKDAYGWYARFADYFHDVALAGHHQWPMKFKTSRSPSDEPLSIWLSPKVSSHTQEQHEKFLEVMLPKK